jgi:hypothetical protein
MHIINELNKILSCCDSNPRKPVETLAVEYTHVDMRILDHVDRFKSSFSSSSNIVRRDRKGLPDPTLE